MLPTRPYIQGNDFFTIDHRDGVVPKITDALLDLRLHLLEIFPRLHRCLFLIAIRACLTIHFYLEACADIFLAHPPLPCTNVADESPAIIDKKSASSRA
jgi:hypothetical protein